MAEDHRLIDTIAEAFDPIHRDGHKFIALFAIVTLILFWVWFPLGWLGALATAWCAYFFRDPERVSPLREGLIVSAADGRITNIEDVVPPPEFGLGDQRRTRISVFLSVLDVHITRAAMAGRIAYTHYRPGLFLNAELDKASEDNEARATVIEAASGARIGMVQIAGLVARRIVNYVREGQPVAVGERTGLIRFGSRVDIYLPPGIAPLVCVGQRAVGGETVFADLKSSEPPREARLD